MKEKIKGFRGSITLSGGRIGVLLIHSLGGNPQELRFVAQSLGQQGFTVYCPLLPGLGGSTDVLGLSSWRDWYKAIEIAHDDLKEHCDIIFVGGLSAGAILSLRLARERPSEVHGLILYAPTLWPNGWAVPKSLYLFRFIYTKWFARFFHLQQRAPYGIKDDRIRKFVLESFRNDERPLEDLFGRGGGLMFEFMKLTKDVYKRLSHIKQETALFHSKEDDISDFSNALTLQRKIAGPLEVTVLNDCFHMITLDRQRSIVVDRTINFIKRMAKEIDEKNTLQSLKQNNLQRPENLESAS
ncbi:MAG: alpha/beta hydrolase [Hyphomicrobium sp.]